jgi:hypothetical protein
LLACASRPLTSLFLAGYKWVLVKEGEETSIARSRDAKLSGGPEDDPSSTAALDRHYSSSLLGHFGSSADSERMRDMVSLPATIAAHLHGGLS